MLVLAHMEESLSDTLVDNYQRVLWKILFLCVTVLFTDNLVELLEFVTDDLGSHGISNTVSVDENVIWEGAVVVVLKSSKGFLEVLFEHARADDLLALLALGTGLGVVLTHVLVVSSAIADDALFTFMANIDSDKHGLFGDFRSEVKAPKVTSELCVDLSEDIDIDPVVVLLDDLG